MPLIGRRRSVSQPLIRRPYFFFYRLAHALLLLPRRESSDYGSSFLYPRRRIPEAELAEIQTQSSQNAFRSLLAQVFCGGEGCLSCIVPSAMISNGMHSG